MPEGNAVQTWLGVDMNLQVEGKHEDLGVKSGDSGGTTLLAGPSLKVRMNEHISILANILLPVAQNLGGVHQEQNSVGTPRRRSPGNARLNTHL